MDCNGIEKKLVRITSYDVDGTNRLRPVSFVNYFQDLAGENCERLGFGFEKLMEQRLVWIVSKIKMEVLSWPLWNDTIEINTWSRGKNGIFYLRDFCAKDLNGKILARLTSEWVLIDIDKRKLADNDKDILSAALCNESLFENRCVKLHFKDDIRTDFTSPFEHNVSYSDIDRVGHANNAMYLAWVMDVLPYQIIQNHQLEYYEINFSNEVRLGESVKISYCIKNENDKKVVYAQGCAANKVSFLMMLKFK